MTTKPARKLLKYEKALLALYRVADTSDAKVPFEEIVVQAWRDFPQDFALRNYPQYPDTGDVNKCLYKGPLKDRGLVLSLGNKFFRLTDKGLHVAEQINMQLEGKSAASAKVSLRLSRTEEAIVQHALRSQAFQAWMSGKGDRLIDYDAQLFFRFSTSTPVDERRRRVAAACEAIAKARRMKMQNSVELSALADHLADRFMTLFEEK